MEEKPEPRVGSFVTWVLAACPALLVLGVVVLALHVWLGVGHWPLTTRDHYDTRAFHLHARLLIWFAAGSLLAAPPLWLLSLCARRFRLPPQVHLLQVGFYLVGWLTIGALLAADPGNFFDWLAD
jgi:hypothetical protein